jgi:hypothetical protein
VFSAAIREDLLGNRVEMVEKSERRNRFVDGTEVANAAHVK